MTIHQNFDFTNPVEETGQVSGKKRRYKNMVKGIFEHNKKAKTSYAILGFLLLSFLTLSLVYLLHQKAIINQTKNLNPNIVKTTNGQGFEQKLEEKNMVEYKIIFQKKSDFELVQKSEKKASKIFPELNVRQDIFSLKNAGQNEQKLLEIEVFENPEKINFEKFVEDFKNKTKWSGDVKIEKKTVENGQIDQAIFAQKYKIVKTEKNVFLLNFENEQKDVEQILNQSIIFN